MEIVSTIFEVFILSSTIQVSKKLFHDKYQIVQINYPRDQ